VAIELLCRKIGMTQVFDDKGNCIPVTVLAAEPNVVVQKKLAATDGYSALQLGGAGTRRNQLVSKAELGHYGKAGVAAPRKLAESRLPEEQVAGYQVGQAIGGKDVFEKGQRVDVAGTSKGRGMAGVVKRHNFPGKGHSHGAHEVFRHGGAIGCRSYPGRVRPGLRMPGHMGSERVTVRNLELVDLDAERNLLFVRGAVPGHRNAVVTVRRAVAPHQ
jgi:large subunit ribosomal protein L3